MIVLGIILLVAGFLLKISILWTIGIILLVIGVVLAILGSAGRPGGRRHYLTTTNRPPHERTRHATTMPVSASTPVLSEYRRSGEPSQTKPTCISCRTRESPSLCVHSASGSVEQCADSQSVADLLDVHGRRISRACRWFWSRGIP
jgi:hypothetical protein